MFMVHDATVLTLYTGHTGTVSFRWVKVDCTILVNRYNIATILIFEGFIFEMTAIRIIFLKVTTNI